MRSTLVLLFLSVLTSSVVAQEHGTWILNSEGAPLFLTAKGPDLTVRNQSGLTILAYQLGCITTSAGRFDEVYHFKPIEKEFKPEIEMFKVVFDGRLDEQIACEKRGEKLVVLEVTFEGGKIWRLRDVLSPSESKKDP